MKAFNVRISIPYFPTRTLVVLARDSVSALLHIIETVPTACCISVRPQ